MSKPDLFTSYYYNSVIHNRGAISISLYPPKNIDIKYSIPELAPPPALLHGYKAGNITEKEYIRTFNKTLKKLDINVIMGKILGVIDDEGSACLCCFCSPKKFCHRHLVAYWIVEQTKKIYGDGHGEDIWEYGKYASYHAPSRKKGYVGGAVATM